MAKLASHHAYQRIIGMGDQAIPLLLRELQREVDLWFWALEAITGEDPFGRSIGETLTKWQEIGLFGARSAAISTDRIYRSFPALRSDQHSITSPTSPRYNCIAWAAGDDSKWWSPQLYWPPEVQDEFGDDFTIISVTAVYARLGFLPCGMDVTLEEGVDKVAIYAIGDEATHAARQLPNGLWTSKLGPYEDITHTLKGLRAENTVTWSAS